MALDLNAQLVQGNPYVFYFSSAGLLGVLPSTNSVEHGLAGDSNFGDPSVFSGPKGLVVNFTYAGQGSTVGAAGGELESVINTNRNMVSDSVTFASAADGSDTSSDPSGASNYLTWILVGALVIAIVLMAFEGRLLERETV